MDEFLEQQLDAAVEDEIRRGWRIKTLPDHILETLQETRDQGVEIPEIKRIRLVKLTAKKKRLINSHVVTRYHKDLKNPALLSSAQLIKINIERGEWSKEEDLRIVEMQTESQTLIRSLYGKDVTNREQWLVDQMEAEDSLRELIERGKDHDEIEVLQNSDTQEVVLDMIARWVGYSVELQDVYDELYAEKQGTEVYNPAQDFNKLVALVRSSEALEQLAIIEDMKANVAEYLKCLTIRGDLMTLQMKKAKIMQESVEQRRDQTQEMAQMYYCCEIINDDGKTVGPVMPNYDDIWDLPDEVVQWFLVELYLFFDGTSDTDETREFLEQWGFIQAPQKAPVVGSDESPEEPLSSSDSEPSEEMLVDSSD